MKYNIDPELELISKIKMPNNPKLLPFMNAACRAFLCKSDDKVTVKRYGMPGYGGASLVVHVIEPKNAEKKGKPLPGLVFFHGGGFMLRASGGHYKIAKMYAEKLPCKVIYVDYRLAPKHPFPIRKEGIFLRQEWKCILALPRLQAWWFLSKPKIPLDALLYLFVWRYF